MKDFGDVVTEVAKLLSVKAHNTGESLRWNH
jgi:hypothetical protein